MKRLIVLLILMTMFYGLVAETEKDTFRAADTGLLLIPTATTLPGGRYQLSTWWLVVYSLGYGLTDDLQINGTTVFPFNKEALDGLTLSGKYRFYKKGRHSAAAWLTTTPFLDLVSLGGVGSYHYKALRLHGGLGLGLDYGKDEQIGVFMGGFDVSMGTRRAFFTEFFAADRTISDDLRYPITLGYRHFGKDYSADLAMVRMAQVDKDQWLWLLILKGSFHF
ncbi:MAG: hypothetical protein Q8M98_07625 [Candidatus Cloacimonadaceae bacterium]|nr:hypothetical protein [Candidatus Cloacimonadaceae bacterium]MDP3114633.1 hypothetical protein [Candidatus Cloacimonadaceae bacterium]